MENSCDSTRLISNSGLEDSPVQKFPCTILPFLILYCLSLHWWNNRSKWHFQKSRSWKDGDNNYQNNYQNHLESFCFCFFNTDVVLIFHHKTQTYKPTRSVESESLRIGLRSRSDNKSMPYCLETACNHTWKESLQMQLSVSRWDHPGLSRWTLNSMTSILIRDTEKKRRPCKDRGRD